MVNATPGMVMHHFHVKAVQQKELMWANECEMLVFS